MRLHCVGVVKRTGGQDLNLTLDGCPPSITFERASRDGQSEGLG